MAHPTAEPVETLSTKFSKKIESENQPGLNPPPIEYAWKCSNGSSPKIVFWSTQGWFHHILDINQAGGQQATKIPPVQEPL